MTIEEKAKAYEEGEKAKAYDEAKESSREIFYNDNSSINLKRAKVKS